jgi:hypothetical protein
MTRATLPLLAVVALAWAVVVEIVYLVARQRGTDDGANGTR